VLAKNVQHLVAVFVVALIFQQSLWCYHTLCWWVMPLR
jgi:hypothetical protein